MKHASSAQAALLKPTKSSSDRLDVAAQGAEGAETVQSQLAILPLSFGELKSASVSDSDVVRLETNAGRTLVIGGLRDAEGALRAIEAARKKWRWKLAALLGKSKAANTAASGGTSAGFGAIVDAIRARAADERETVLHGRLNLGR